MCVDGTPTTVHAMSAFLPISMSTTQCQCLGQCQQPKTIHGYV